MTHHVYSHCFSTGEAGSTPRRVHISCGFYETDGYKRNQGVIDALLKRVANGQDLTPQLSRGVDKAYVSPRSADGKLRKRRPDVDGLLAERGIHHLHLSLDVGPDGYSRRTNDLLFVVFRPEEAYVVAVYPHSGAWTKRALVETCVRNWPTAGLFHASRFVIGLNQTPSEEEW